MTRMDKDLYPFFIVLFLSVVALVMFWSVLDMVILGASLAVVLLPLHHRLLTVYPTGPLLGYYYRLPYCSPCRDCLCHHDDSPSQYRAPFRPDICNDPSRGSRIPPRIRVHSGFRSARIRSIYGLIKEMHSLSITGQ